MTPLRFKPVAERALLIEFASEVSDAANDAVIALDRAIAAAKIEGVREVIPAFVNLLVEFDPLTTDHAAIEAAVRALLPLRASDEEARREREVLVCYEGEFAPDLSAVARACNMSEDAVIAAHLSGDYRVCMYGFAPGYAYLSGVPNEIQVPRKRAALRDIASGSVMIAGPQCLTTTMVMPTGWTIIGRSPTQILREKHERPFLFNVGDRVVFRRISADEFAALNKAVSA